MPEPTDIKEFQGRVKSIDLNKRTLIMEDESDVDHPFHWPDLLDDLMKRWREGFYLTITYHDETYLIKNASYWQEGKEVWAKLRPQQKGYGGGKPRNERIIAMECCIKVAADIWIAGSDKSLKYEEVMKKITAEGIKAAEELCKAGGVT